MFRVCLFLIASFFISGVIIASVFPEGSQRAGFEDLYMGFQTESDIKLQCQQTGNRVWGHQSFNAERVSDVRNWCNGRLAAFGIEWTQQAFDERCGWNQVSVGRYGNYEYHGNFYHYTDWPGSTRFQVQPLCTDDYDDNGDYIGGGGY